MGDLSARIGADEKRFVPPIVRINTIESTSPPANGDNNDEGALPPALVPSEPDAPDAAYEKLEARDRVRAAIQSLPWRERKVIGLYYYGEVTMKEIGAEIGVNESRVSQLHARAIRRLREALGQIGARQLAEIRHALVAFAAKPAVVKAHLPSDRAETVAATPAVVLPYKARAKRTMAPRPAAKVDRARRPLAVAR